MTTTPRRRVLRPARTLELVERQHQEALTKQSAKLEKERQGFRRWLTRLKRAMHALEKHQRRLARLEKVMALLQRV